MQQFYILLSWHLFTAQNVSGVFPGHHQELNDCSGSLWFYLCIVVTVVLCLWSGQLWPDRPRTQHDYHHDTKVKPEAATAVIELLMMGGKTSETCWAVNKPQDNKLENCCIRLVIYLNCAMIHGLTNLKFTHRCRNFKTHSLFIIALRLYSIRCNLKSAAHTMSITDSTKSKIFDDHWTTFKMRTNTWFELTILLRRNKQNNSSAECLIF